MQSVFFFCSFVYFFIFFPITIAIIFLMLEKSNDIIEIDEVENERDDEGEKKIFFLYINVKQS